MVKTKVFVSFDYDNDKTLKDFIIGQVFDKVSGAKFKLGPEQAVGQISFLKCPLFN